MTCQYIIADSRKLSAIYAEKRLDKADIILTSPPYYDVKSYDNLDSQIGYKQTYHEYLDDTVNVLQQCYEVSTSNATLWLVVDTIQRNGCLLPIPFDINRTLNDLAHNNSSTQDTWILRDIIIWNRSKNLPWHSRGRLKHEFEYILFFSKTDQYKYYIDKIRSIDYSSEWWLTYPERYNSSGRPPSNVWEFTIPIRGWGNGYQQHLCPLPFPLIERILSISSDENDVVLDPFSGSGSVIALANQMGRNAIGFDISIKYKEQFEAEVQIGAQKYWGNRSLELNKTQSKIKLFRDTNIKLRKIKAGIKLTKKIRGRIKDNNAVFLLMDVQDQNAGINLVVLQDELSHESTMLNYTDSIKKLHDEYNIDISLSFGQKDLLLSEQLKNKTLFAYSNDKIYKYLDTFSVSQIADNVLRPNCVFSNIEININNPNNFFD